MPKPKTSLIHTLTDEQIIEGVNECNSLSQLMVFLNLRGGTPFALLRTRVQKLNLYEKYEKRCGWRAGLNSRTDPRIKSSIPEERFFSTRSFANTSIIKAAFIDLLDEKNKCCSRCKLTTWEGEKLPLELDHVNGNNRDNTKENLRLLCPNCHSLTPTWRGRSKNKKEKISDDVLLKALNEHDSISAALRSLGLANANNYGRCYRLLIKDQNLHKPNIS